VKTAEDKERDRQDTEALRRPEEFHALGRPIIEAKVKDYIQRDSLRLAVPIVLLVVFVLFMNFRSLRGIALPSSS